MRPRGRRDHSLELSWDHPYFKRRNARNPNFSLSYLFVAMLCAMLCLPCHAIKEAQYRLQAKSFLRWDGCGEINSHAVECSRINVPMDHFNKPNNKTFSIPLIRMLATNASATGGKSIFLNPGGPGASGISFLRGAGATLSKVIGEGFHLLSFDPRGVQGSVPQANCFVTSAQRTENTKRDLWNAEFEAGKLYTRAENVGKACADTSGQHGRYINTPQTAADMNSILDAIGQEKMYYWGFSYGTILGQTYAQMFPERVSRLVIDGVVDMNHWYNVFADYKILIDTDTTYSGFIEECFNAKRNCALNSIRKTAFETASDLQSYMDDFIERLEDEPIPVYLNNTRFGAVTRQGVALNGIFQALYKPAPVWPMLAQNLAELIMGNATRAFIEYSQTGNPSWMTDDSNKFIAFNDNWKTGPEAPVHGISAIAKYALSQEETSTLASKYYSSVAFDRAAWSIPTTHGFHPHYYPEYPRVKTAEPILVLSTTHDPVCPLVSARKAFNSFEGAGLVVQKSYGHCTLSMPSLCTTKHIRRYFTEGLMPKPDSTCEIDAEYFPSPDKVTFSATHNLSAEDAELLLALEDLAARWDVYGISD